jgi:aldehyde:ferredoxin oxidoreductase
VLERALLAGDAAPVVFAAGPFAATAVPAGNEHAVAAISPVTGRVVDHLAPGHWSSLMRRCGLAAIALTGTCDGWTTIAIENGRVSWLDARDHLGLPGRDVTKRMREWYGDRSVRVCAIGEAGERGSPFATLACDGRAGGRGGIGTALGAKRVKAVALRGRGDVAVADPATTESLAEGIRDRVLAAPLPRAASPASLIRERKSRGVPSRNFASDAFPELAAFSRAFESRDAYVELRAGCAPCAVQCEHMYLRKERDRRQAAAADIEGVWAFGPLCDVADGAAVLDALTRCEAYGLDTVSTGVALAFAMEAAERGMLAADLRFGDGAALVGAVDQIASAAGPLAVVAGGVRAAADALGGDARDFAVHVAGLECGWSDPRIMPHDALAAVLDARYDASFDGSGSFADAEDRASLRDALVLCPFASAGFAELAASAAPLVAAVTGLDVDEAALRASARATYDRRVRLGARTPDRPHALPQRFAEPLRDGPFAGASVVADELAQMLSAYRAARA